jgi:hypothetical protein
LLTGDRSDDCTASCGCTMTLVRPIYAGLRWLTRGGSASPQPLVRDPGSMTTGRSVRRHRRHSVILCWPRHIEGAAVCRSRKLPSH